MKKKGTVTACVTSQKNCRRIVLAAKKIAEEKNCRLNVLSVQKSGEITAEQCEAIEYLYKISKQNNAQMSVLFSENTVLTAIDFLKRSNTDCIVTGLPNEQGEGFIGTVCSVLPKICVSMISEDEKIYTYCNLKCNAVSACTV